MNFFENVPLSPADPLFGLNRDFLADDRKNKVNLGIGVYRKKDLSPLILSSVKRAEGYLLENETSKDYLPIDGLASYLQASKELVFGLEENDRIYATQTVGGTGALTVGAMFLKEHGFSTIYVSEQTWDNHHRVFKRAGLEVKTYPYFNWSHRSFDFEPFCEALEQIPPKSILVLQPCCHNPTGVNPTEQQWAEICQRAKERRLFVFFDCAYQGFGEGVEQDVKALRLFMEEGLPFALAVSHSKNFGLYAERTGALFFVCDNSEQVKRVGSCVKVLIRGLYSNPPCHGARIVSTILNTFELKELWLHELAGIRERISEMRKLLIAQLRPPFDFLAQQKGMFSYTGLDKDQVGRLIAEYGIYLPKDGRINLAGLNTDNLDYVVKAILAVTKYNEISTV